MLFIFLIGMISLTSMATTPLTEQKQKMTSENEISHYSIVNNVEMNDYSVITSDNRIVQSETTLLFTNKNFEHFISYAIIKDVGWNSEIQFVSNTIYQEKLNQKYLLNISENIRKLGIKRNWGNS